MKEKCPEQDITGDKLVALAATSAIAISKCMSIEDLVLFSDFIGLLRYDIDMIIRQRKRRILN